MKSYEHLQNPLNLKFSQEIVLRYSKYAVILVTKNKIK